MKSDETEEEDEVDDSHNEMVTVFLAIIIIELALIAFFLFLIVKWLRLL